MDILISAILVLLVVWIFGFLIFPVAGALIHVLLVIAVVMVLWRIIQGKNPFK